MENRGPDSQTPTAVTIVERVSELEEEDPLNLPPLYNSIDPDLFGRLSNSNQIQFEYLGYKGTV